MEDDSFEEQEQSGEEEEEEEPPIPIFDFYKYIGRPNPIRQSSNRVTYPLQTPFLQTVRKLPDSLELVSMEVAPRMPSLVESAERVMNRATQPVYQGTLSARFAKKTPVYSRFRSLHPDRPCFATVAVDWRRKHKVYRKLQQCFSRSGGVLHFDSRFECGNLLAAYQVSSLQFELVLQNDVNTKGHTQWFFFSVAGLQLNVPYRFTILNLCKSGSLFGEGMAPALFSRQRHRQRGQGWNREGYFIEYQKTGLAREDGDGYYYRLSWTYTPQFADDMLYFAHSPPYAPTSLWRFLEKLPTQTARVRNVGFTVCRNAVPMVQLGKHEKGKPQVLFLARQHPGEVTGSWVVEGIVQYFLDNPEALQQVTVKILPMLNVDGVIAGNYRTGTNGLDFNRNWHTNSKLNFPEVFAAKDLLHQMEEVALVVDLHSHSRSLSSFFYSAATQPSHIARLKGYSNSLAELPFFSAEKCRFKRIVHRSARQFFCQQVPGASVFTLETSLCGFKKQKNIVFFGPDHLRQMGKALSQALLRATVKSSPIEIKATQVQLAKMKNIVEQARLKEQSTPGQQNTAAKPPGKVVAEQSKVETVKPDVRVRTEPEQLWQLDSDDEEDGAGQLTQEEIKKCTRKRREEDQVESRQPASQKQAPRKLVLKNRKRVQSCAIRERGENCVARAESKAPLQAIVNRQTCLKRALLKLQSKEGRARTKEKTFRPMQKRNFRSRPKENDNFLPKVAEHR